MPSLMKQEQISQLNRKMIGQIRISLIARLLDSSISQTQLQNRSKNIISSLSRIMKDEVAIHFFFFVSYLVPIDSNTASTTSKSISTAATCVLYS